MRVALSDLVARASVVRRRYRGSKDIVVRYRQVVRAADPCPARGVTQDHSLVVGQILHPDAGLRLRHPGPGEFAPQDEHGDAIQPGAIGPDDGAITPESDIGDRSFEAPAGLVDQQAFVESRRGGERTESALAPRARVLEPCERALEMLRSHGVRAGRQLPRIADRHDEPGPVPVYPHTRVRLAAKCVPDPVADQVPAELPAIDLQVGRHEPGQVQVKSAGPAVADLHGGEMTPAFVADERDRLGIGRPSVDLCASYFIRHASQYARGREPPDFRNAAVAVSAG